MPENKDIQPKPSEIKLQVPDPKENMILELKLSMIESSLKQSLKEIRELKQEIKK